MNAIIGDQVPSSKNAALMQLTAAALQSVKGPAPLDGVLINPSRQSHLHQQKTE